MNHKTQEVRTYENGTIEWYFNGKRHRTDGPAVIHPDGYQVWYLNGKLHRTDGPAVIYSSGYQAWYQDGKRHRTDGPAVIDSDGGQAWYLNGKPHRTDGPAVVYSDGTKEWYLDNERFTEEEYLLRIQTPEQLLLKEIAKLLLPTKENTTLALEHTLSCQAT